VSILDAAYTQYIYIYIIFAYYADDKPQLQIWIK